MKRIFLFLVAITTFSIGCGLSGLYQSYLKQLVVVPPKVEIPAQRRQVSLDGITRTVIGCGILGYNQAYQLPNGTKLSEGITRFDSFEEAQAISNKWLERADRILERTAPGQQVACKPRSDRIVAAFPKDKYRDEHVEIMWIEGSCVHYLSAPSLEYALEFEKSTFNPHQFFAANEAPKPKSEPNSCPLKSKS